MYRTVSGEAFDLAFFVDAGGVGFLAVLAQSLRTSRWAITPTTVAPDEIGFDADVVEAGDGAGGVVGVQGAEHQVSGQGGLRGDPGSVGIADFTDHHDVRVLPQQRPQGVCEGEPSLVVYLELIDAAQDIFNRILDGADVDVVAVEFLEHGVERGAFA